MNIEVFFLRFHFPWEYLSKSSFKFVKFWQLKRKFKNKKIGKFEWSKIWKIGTMPIWVLQYLKIWKFETSSVKNFGISKAIKFEDLKHRKLGSVKHRQHKHLKVYTFDIQISNIGKLKFYTYLQFFLQPP